MAGTKASHRAFVAKFGDENREFYGSPDGRGLLAVIDLTFDNRWVYLYELVQNALDVGASSIRIRLAGAGDALIFQHNGERSLDEEDVEGLSKVFRSTKGARSVGFMGIGFKSVFIRFQEALFSGWGWTFRYDITQVVGQEFGDVQRDLLGSVVPIWDDEIAAPEDEFTTRFEMRRRTDKGTDLKSDLVRFLPGDDHAPLAILAMSGLERLEMDGRIWELGVSEEPDGSFEATAISEHENWLWRVFPAQLQPSRKAIACFLEHRKIRPNQNDSEQVYADAARTRRVLGVLPLDNDGVPMPPTRGNVYATLPTEVTLPFGLHINADWLLNISRSGLREIEVNPWQREIVEKISDILARFLHWSANSHSHPDAARAAFKVLGQPSSEAGGLESLLAEECWLSTFRDRIEDAAVLPVWTETTATLAYAKAGDTLVPPAPLAKAFENQPDLSPAVLLNGHVLMEEVLGRKAAGLLRRIGLLTDMSPEILESVWEDGLEDWWKSLSEEQGHRRRLLFRLWAAIAELSSDDAWRKLNVRCVRSVTEEWIAVDGVAFLNEALAADDEPGGIETRRLMQPVIPDADRFDSEWVATRRQRRQQESEHNIRARAWDWIEEHARSISLREIVENAFDSLASRTDPDWSVLVPYGHWAKHRNRADLLTHVLVQSNGDQLGIPVGDALIADPYVEHGQDRRRLLSDVAAIAAVYMETDPKSAGAHEWRTFFENAGAKGRVEVRASRNTANRLEPREVAAFLGDDLNAIPGCNNKGYTLLDFDIGPSLPSVDAPRELRAALASWLEDGFRVLKGKGRRKVTYTYYSGHERTGNKSSAWVAKLSQLAWVPCNDDFLRRPRDVLGNFDPAREDAPLANLSSQFLSALNQEGVNFGTTIPEATSLRRLSAADSELDTAALSGLLSECREQATKGIDRDLFNEVLQDVRLPTSDGRRITLDRVVQRVGGRLRGALGGWIVPLDRIEEILRTELENADFPREFPETTTGGQALGYIRDIWKRARMSPDGLANEVRDVLPTAYAYCVDDSAQDASLLERWQSALPEAMIFMDREWIALTDSEDLYLDDIDDRRFSPRQAQLRTVTGGHLGRSRCEQLRVAEAIGLPPLSSCITMDWIGGDVRLPISHDWIYRFELICKLLRRVRGSESMEEDGPDTGIETRTEPSLIRVSGLALDVSIGMSTAERVPVNARLHEGTLTVAGCPLQFGADAAKELLRDFSFGQRAGLAADLTGMLMAIDGADFNLAAYKFQRSHVPDFELPTTSEIDLDNGESTGSGDEFSDDVESLDPTEGAGANGDLDKRQAPTSGTSEQGEPDPSGNATADNINTATTEKSEREESGSVGGSYSKDRALAKQNALAHQLRSSLKGEIVPDLEEDGAGEAAAINGDTDKSLGDEEYREVAAQYERETGREPELGDPYQSGWDIRSIDPKTQEIRLIEVKGKGCPWDDAEVVELSGAQIRKALEAKESWYLYVVEKTDEGSYQVLPIANPVRVAAKWILCGESWRMVAEEAKAVVSPPN